MDFDTHDKQVGAGFVVIMLDSVQGKKTDNTWRRNCSGFRSR